MSEFFSALKISGSGMAVQRLKLNATAENIANAETSRTPEGGPYRRKNVQIEADNQSMNFSGEFKRARLNLAQTHDKHKPSVRRFSTQNVEVSEAKGRVITNRRPEINMVYDPTHPDADGDGYVAMPDINLVTEMVNMMVASRAFEANVTAVSATKEMVSEAMGI
ncbi:MAG: flagellar basal body rod protein FlgC [Candidatus Zixiibacteriota bacterium]